MPRSKLRNVIPSGSAKDLPLSDAVCAGRSPTGPALMAGAAAAGPANLQLVEKIKELVRLAQEQGYLTYNDINEALPDSLIAGEDIDEIYVQWRNLEVEIVDAAAVDRIKVPEQEEDEEKSRLDIL